MRLLVLVPALVLPSGLCAQFDAYEREPIRYGATPADDPVARLGKRIEEGKARLEHEAGLGYLRGVLRELGIPASSQTLVFSKTSFQRERISPAAPRAIYFNDDVYVGWVRGGEVMELAAMDPRLGMVFYTLSQEPPSPERREGASRFRRLDAECLQCHASALTRGIPGALVRSVHPDPAGQPVLRAGTFLTDHSSPLRQRWGGWYVTGTHGAQRHLGNLVLAGDADPPRLDLEAGANLTDLSGRFETADYLTPHSDLAALMVLEHQAQMQNLITSAGYQARLALHEQGDLNAMEGLPRDRLRDSTRRRFEHAALPLLRYLLLVEETPLAAPLRGTSRFAEEYSARGPRDRRGRSLYQLDLERRLYRHPCSPLIHSEAFDRFPEPFREHLFRRLGEVLTAPDPAKDFADLAAEDRRAVLEILLETRRGLPESFRALAGPARREEL